MTREEIEAAKARDERLRMIDEGFAIAADLRDNPTIKALLAKLEGDASAAMIALSDLSPLDSVAVARELVLIRAYVYVRTGLMQLIRRSENMAVAMSQEETMRSYERDD